MDSIVVIPGFDFSNRMPKEPDQDEDRADKEGGNFQSNADAVLTPGSRAESSGIPVKC
ncbi:MAG: hypothetical protein ACRCV5_19270 [Afipia sp.]